MASPLRGALVLAFMAAVARASPVNVLFIVVDDLAPTLASYGYPDMVTPGFDALSSSDGAVQFDRAYVSVSVCAPSRTAFLTGLRPDTTQAWTIGPYFRTASRGQGNEIVTLPQLFKQMGYNSTGSGKIFHPGTASGGMTSSEGGGDLCPVSSSVANCPEGSGDADAVSSWSEPYFFCDQFTNDTVQSPLMQHFPCATGWGAPFPSCGSGCVQNETCVQCFKDAGTWGDSSLLWAATDWLVFLFRLFASAASILNQSCCQSC